MRSRNRKSDKTVTCKHNIFDLVQPGDGLPSDKGQEVFLIQWPILTELKSKTNTHGPRSYMSHMCFCIIDRVLIYEWKGNNLYSFNYNKTSLQSRHEVSLKLSDRIYVDTRWESKETGETGDVTSTLTVETYRSNNKL